ncbi:MAG: bifunctional protein tyrosine phosphatase family protein/NAD(P)/FAD-dependent oxidoreductase, partial [Proteobacteria bacterium]|nr:bifunctional protein tyrosine phosphatase family protein/NAD(P)/FAD-dependent oxidoreductase [Pseudomonadota bacterium]
AAKGAGIEAVQIAFKSGEMKPGQVAEFADLLGTKKKIHAYCRTGNRSFNLYSAAFAASGGPKEEILAKAEQVGINVNDTINPYYSGDQNSMAAEAKISQFQSGATPSYDVVIVGAGSGGISAASSLLKRVSGIRIALIDPAEEHFYQPGWTMVGGGVFDVTSTRRRMEDLIPARTTWIKQAVKGFHPAENEVELEDGSHIGYEQLIVAPGLKLNLDAVKGFRESLGKNGVTTNYLYQYAPYTFELVKGLKQGKALFTQPPMPIKCAGAPQKALYLSCDYWRRNNVLNNIDVDFMNAGGVLFGVSDYVPALQSYIDRYGANVNYNCNLEAIDADAKTAQFRVVAGEREGEEITKPFDMIHVCPPQCAPDFVSQSELAGPGGWLEVDQFSLQHVRFANVWGLGDVMNTPNAKTMAAVRKQVPVVAQNIADVLKGRTIHSGYDGYGSCPLTVENGKIVLAEFGYGGKILPTFPTWLLQGKNPTRSAWILKKDILPGIYWNAMLKGREWMAGPQDLDRLRS